jgi:putative ABC transport system permease protein
MTRSSLPSPSKQGPGVDPEVLAKRIRDTFGARGIITTLNREIRQQLKQTIDEGFAFTNAIRYAALSVGLLGLLNTLLVSLFQRMREIGMLRAMGMSRRQLVATSTAEALLLGVLGGAVSAAFGVLVSQQWVVHALSATLGWIVDVHIPWSPLLETIGAGTLVGVVAGAIVAIRLRRMQIREALQQA